MFLLHGGRGGQETSLKVFHLAKKVWVYLFTSTNMQISQLLCAWGTYPALCCLSSASWWVFQHRALLGFFLQLWELFLGLIFLMLNGATAVRMSDPILRVLHSMWATVYKRALKSGLTFPETTCELLAVLDLHSFTLGLQGCFSLGKKKTTTWELVCSHRVSASMNLLHIFHYNLLH